MAYSTRRKSVNLSLLGIHVPRPHQHHQHQRSPPITAAMPADSFQPPQKKLKTSHTDAAAAAAAAAAAPEAAHYFSKQSVSKITAPSQAVRTPPASPPPPPPPATSETQDQHHQYPKVDTEGINDDVVVATIDLLEKSNNRPHMLKELAAQIASIVPVVETSANQSAIISSRLTNFLKRPWTPLAPCPLGKELIGTHPKRLFFFLSARPHQPFPEPERTVSAARIITPSLTSATDDDEPQSRRRSELSPSPELTFDSPDLEEDDAHLSRTTSFPMLPTDSVPTPGFAQSRTSPALERDEREFTQTAHTLQQIRRLELLDQLAKAQAQDFNVKLDKPADESMILEDAPAESVEKLNHEDAQVVFGQTDSLLIRNTTFLGSSPMMYPQRDAEKPLPPPLTLPPIGEKLEASFVWTELKSPEAVELDELENLLESY